MLFSLSEVENMVCVKKGPYHGPAPIPEEGLWVQSREIQDISGLSVRTLLEALSEQSFDDFSLADWVSLYRKGKELHKQKQEKVVSRERSQKN